MQCWKRWSSSAVDASERPFLVWTEEGSSCLRKDYRVLELYAFWDDSVIWWCHMMVSYDDGVIWRYMLSYDGDVVCYMMISWWHMLMISLFVIGDQMNLCMWGRCSTPVFYPFSVYLDTVSHTMPELTWNSHCSISSRWLGDLYTSSVPWLSGTKSIHNQAWLSLWPINYTAIKKKLACFESY